MFIVLIGQTLSNRSNAASCSNHCLKCVQICEAHFCGCGTEASSLCGDARCTSADEHYAAVCRRLHEHAARMLCFLTRVRESERALELLAASSDLYQVCAIPSLIAITQNPQILCSCM